MTKKELTLPSYSFEVFPPKRDGDKKQIYDTLEAIAVHNPDFISVTFGAAGSDRGRETLDMCVHIQEKLCIRPLMHLTCVGADKPAIERIFDAMEENGIRSTLLLRGDKKEGVDDENQLTDFHYAKDLIDYAVKNRDFTVGAACYPEGHIESKTLTADLLHLREKVHSGTDFLITQFFFDNEKFYHFKEQARSVDIDVPIYAGIMPVLNKNQIHKMVSLSGASLPQKFARVLERYEHNPRALQDAGIAYASEQIVDLLSSGVDGIHLYVMNKPEIAKRISENIGSILKDLKGQRHCA